MLRRILITASLAMALCLGISFPNGSGTIVNEVHADGGGGPTLSASLLESIMKVYSCCENIPMDDCIAMFYAGELLVSEEYSQDGKLIGYYVEKLNGSGGNIIYVIEEG